MDANHRWNLNAHGVAGLAVLHCIDTSVQSMAFVIGLTARKRERGEGCF